MRNALVVLVPLCFGLTFGFIVPSGIQEIMTDLKDNLNSTTSQRSNTLLLNTAKVASTSGTTATIFKDKVTSNFLQKELYENSQAKEADLKTRAYIYIKQHDRKPIKNRLFNSPMNTLQTDRNSQKSYMMNFKVFEELPRQFSIGYLSQNLYANRESHEHDHRCCAMRAKQNNNQAKSKINSETQEYLKTLTKEQREYLERLRTPLFRAEVQNNKAANSIKHLSTINYQKGAPYYANYPPGMNNNVKSINRNTDEEKMRDKGILLDVNGQKNYQKGLQGDEFLLDELIKQKLSEDGSLFVCDDCLNKARRNKLRNRVHIEAMCKCASNLLPREVEKNRP